MINFTGQTKKRVVNLGNQRTGSSSKNYLEQTRLQRQQREEQRQRERACLVLQCYIRKYVDLFNRSEIFKEEWLDEADSWECAQDWNNWIIKFEFLSKWLFRRQESNDSLEQLDILYRSLKFNSKFSISSRYFNVLVASLIRIIQQINKKQDSVRLINIIIDCINVLIDNYNPGDSVVFHNLISSLAATLQFSVPDPILFNIVHLVFKVNVHDSCQDFIRFLSLPDIFTKNEFFLNILRSTINKEELCKLSNIQLINLLVNFLTIHGNEEFLQNDYIVIGSIFSYISFSLRKGDEVEELDNEDRGERSDDVLLVDDSIIDKLQILYSSQFIKQAIHHFTKTENDQLSSLALHIFAALIYLVPSSKSKLCMFITITPGSYKWFFNQLKKAPIAEVFNERITAGQDYLRSDDLVQLYSRMSDDSIQDFWKTLYTFEELYSYWLIVSNDLESFSDDKLNLEEVSSLMTFLRFLCLTLVFNTNNKALFNEFNKLRDISISLLNQLYVKNLRLKFLPEDFWKPNELNFNIDSMLQIIAEEEERRIELENASDSDTGLDQSISRKQKFSNANSDTLAKLEVLKKLPFFISFRERVKIFQTLIELDKQRLNPGPFSMLSNVRLKADIRREALLEDAFNSFHKAGRNFKNQLQVIFYNEYGGQEAGIDGGGITKEFLTSVVMEGIKGDLYKETSDNQLYPNDEIYKKLNKKIDVLKQQERLLYLKFLGNIIGKCFYENVLIDISFAPFFLNKWCNDNMKNSINDLNYLDKELFSNLMKLTNMSVDELEELDLNFTINEKLNGKDYVFELAPNGDKIKVNASNKLNYIHQISNFKLNQSLHIQTKYFLEGLFEIISSNWLSMFDSSELQMLISGGENDVNIQDWKENVEYGGYFDDDLTVVYFWEVIRELTPEERFKLIKFVTSVSRAPLLGFGSLSPKFGIRNSGRDIDRLPTASTCVNLLKLPDYQDKELIRSKLLYAINTDARFDLS